MLHKITDEVNLTTQLQHACSHYDKVKYRKHVVHGHHIIKS